MTKPALFKDCESCGKSFRKSWTHQLYCCIACAIEPRIEKRGRHECWPWTGGTNDRGYGQISWNKKRFYVHRLAVLNEGDTLHGFEVLHLCDNPLCCNPEHLSIDTHAANVSDMYAKGRAEWRWHSGSKNGNAKLDENSVRQIRLAINAKIPCRQIAALFRISLPTVYQIKNGRTWRQVE